MIIDSLTDKSSIDIDKLAIPEPVKEREAIFDQKKDLFPGDWDRANKHLAELRQDVFDNFENEEYVLHWANFVADLLMLAPERREEFGIDEGMRQILFRRAEIASGEPLDWVLFLRLSFAAKILYPSDVDSLHLNDGKLEKITAALDDELDLVPFPEDFAELVIFASCLFPDARKDLLTVDEFLEQSLRESLKEPLDADSEDWRDVSTVATCLKILFPEKSQELSRYDRAMMKEELRMLRGYSEIGYFFKLAVNMNILAADVARITPEGKIEIIRDKKDSDMAEKIPEMPVKRAF